MTHPILGPVAVTAAALLLSGCGDFFERVTGGDDTPGIASYDQQVIQSLDLMFDVEGLSATRSDQMPTAGSATYSGVVGFSNESPGQNVSDYDIMSDLSLQADFASGTMTGTIDNFNTRDDQALDGRLTLTEGQIAGNSFTANAIGAFVDGTSAEIWDLEVVADFQGNDGSGIVGTANGSISNGGSESSNIFGDLIAMQD